MCRLYVFRRVSRGFCVVSLQHCTRDVRSVNPGLFTVGTPCGRGLFTQCNRNKRYVGRSFRLLTQCHTGFLWRTITFFSVAKCTTRNDVRPRSFPALRTRHNVIHRHRLLCKRRATVGTVRSISRQNISLVKFDALLATAERLDEPCYEGHLDRQMYRAQFAIALFDDLNLPACEQAHGALPRDGRQRLIIRREEEGLFHGGFR